ncbi:c-type cytochrome [Pseudidiomarina sp. E22-M8]|uniref:c-type cytochrome n=1 Tax=Pseudidiomarina sp. E22-M8 TaxID=3424768 RepID=UPI00403C68BA
MLNTQIINAVLICSLFTGFSAQASSNDEQELIKRGDYLINNVMACGHCHGKNLAGGIVIPEDFGDIHVPNITPHPATGIGTWSRQDIVHALRNGRRPDGSMIGMPMPIGKYKNLSDADAYAIAAYLQTIPPIEHKTPKTNYPAGLLEGLNKVRQPLVSSVEAVDRSDHLAWGKYVATQAHCFSCHTPWQSRELTGAGGNPLPVQRGIYIYSKNITPASRVKDYSDEELEHVIRTGELPDGSILHEMMPAAFYSEMSSADMSALIAYLRSLPPVETENTSERQR